MSVIRRSIEVNVPVSTAYNQWTQFEEFPRFMEGVERVEQLDDRTLYWCAEIAGVRTEWHAEIVEQIPDACISWCSTSGARNAGTVRFTPRGLRHCLVELELEYEPQGAAETVGDWLGVVSGRVDGDLRRFKHFIESRRVETGAWRGAI
ncbi:MAG TPA: SRPBCC family protein [Candidatus Dormibacteraeota bacterium]|nr:SRPBCC family protein [Candidatus Dormibacteraeota bacterium]